MGMAPKLREQCTAPREVNGLRERHRFQNSQAGDRRNQSTLWQYNSTMRNVKAGGVFIVEIDHSTIGVALILLGRRPVDDATHPNIG